MCGKQKKCARKYILSVDIYKLGKGTKMGYFEKYHISIALHCPLISAIPRPSSGSNVWNSDLEYKAQRMIYN